MPIFYDVHGLLVNQNNVCQFITVHVIQCFYFKSLPKFWVKQGQSLQFNQ